MNIFEVAARRKFRFASLQGLMMTESLFDLPLKSRSGADLDSVARDVSRKLKEETEESFVEVKPNQKRADLEVMLEIVKHVISVKVAEADRAKAAKARAEERSKILDAIAHAETAELQGKSKDELLKKLAELDAA